MLRLELCQDKQSSNLAHACLLVLTLTPVGLTLWQAPKHTRKRNTPENAGTRLSPKSAISGVLRFRVCFGALLDRNKEHPRTQHTRKRRFSGRSIIRVFECVAFSGALCSPLNTRVKGERSRSGEGRLQGSGVWRQQLKERDLEGA